MKIWILFHGNTGADHPELAECLRLREEAEKQGATLDIMGVDDFDLVIDSTNEWRAIYKDEYIEAPDLIIPRTGAETTYNAFSVMRFYEGLGIPTINSWSSIESVADKLHSHQILASRGFPVPRTILGKFPPNLDLIEEKLGFPVIIKTLRGTRGGGVFLCETRDQFKDLTDLLADTNSRAKVLFQEYIKGSHGRDLRTFVVGDRVVACMERRSTDGSFKSNISRGGLGQPHPITPAIADLSLRVARALDLEVAGIDLLFDGQTFSVCEANSAPGFCGEDGLESVCRANVARDIISYGMSKVQQGTKSGFWRRLAIKRDVR